MLPYINLGFIKISSYTFMIALGVIAFVITAYIILKKIAKKDFNTIYQTLFISLISLVVMYFSAGFFDALFHSIKEGKFVMSGITWEGGVIGGFTAFLILSHIFIKSERGKEIELFSYIIPGIVLAHAFGRVGCFMAGCCFGTITEGPFGVVFPTDSYVAKVYPNTLTGEGSFPVVPTQLFEVAFELILFAVMLVFNKKLIKYNLSIYLVFYGIFRFILEFWRGDDRGATGFYLSPSQFMSIVLLVVGVLIFLLQKGIVFKKLRLKLDSWSENAKNGVYNVNKNALSSEKEEVFIEIEKLYNLKLSGAITEEEYNSKKTQLLSKIE